MKLGIKALSVECCKLLNYEVIQCEGSFVKEEPLLLRNTILGTLLVLFEPSFRLSTYPCSRVGWFRIFADLQFEHKTGSSMLFSLSAWWGFLEFQTAKNSKKTSQKQQQVSPGCCFPADFTFGVNEGPGAFASGTVQRFERTTEGGASYLGVSADPEEHTFSGSTVKQSMFHFIIIIIKVRSPAAALRCALLICCTNVKDASSYSQHLTDSTTFNQWSLNFIGSISSRWICVCFTFRNKTTLILAFGFSKFCSVHNVMTSKSLFDTDATFAVLFFAWWMVVPSAQHRKEEAMGN